MPDFLKTAAFLLAASTVLLSTAGASPADKGKSKSKKHFSVQIELGAPAVRYGYAPPRVVHVPPPAPPRWEPGHYQVVTRNVWVPGATRRVWSPPVHETHCDPWGRPVVVVRPGQWTTVTEPGRYEQRSEHVWVPGRWVTPGHVHTYGH